LIRLSISQKGDEIWNEDHWEVRGHWFDCKAYNKNNIYRRKLPAVPAVDPGEGWRLLKEGEKIERDDQFWHDRGKEWLIGSAIWIGDPFNDTFQPMRRRIPQPAPVVSVGDRVKVLSGPWAGCTGVVIGSLPMNLKIKMDNVFVGGNNLTMIVGKTSSVEPLPPVVPEVLYRDLSHGETIRVEDEFLFFGNWRAGSTEPRHIGNKLEKWHVRHRRPVRLQSPGWRYLDAGETVQSGDEIARSKVWKWIQCSDSVGKPLTDDYLEHGVYVIRRKLPTISGG